MLAFAIQRNRRCYLVYLVIEGAAFVDHDIGCLPIVRIEGDIENGALRIIRYGSWLERRSTVRHIELVTDSGVEHVLHPPEARIMATKHQCGEFSENRWLYKGSDADRARGDLLDYLSGKRSGRGNRVPARESQDRRGDALDGVYPVVPARA